MDYTTLHLLHFGIIIWTWLPIVISRIIMNKPELYNRSNELQKQSTIECLREHTGHIKWNKIEDTAIDVGCADGSVSVIVKNFSPYRSHSYKKFIACDINEDMIKLANQHYSNEGVTFRVLDIEGDIPEDLIRAFNHVFSFYTLHWVKNQEKAFSNIYNLLTDDGDILLTLVGSSAIYKLYKVLAQHPKWKTWLRDLNLFLSPYYEVQNVEAKITEIAAKHGFKKIDVTCKETTMIHNNVEEVKNMVQSVEPFNMPQKVFDEFFEDFWTIGQEIGLYNFKNDKNGDFQGVIDKYNLIIISANK